MNQPIFGIPFSTWITAATAFGIIAIGLPLIRAFIRRRCPISGHADSSWRNLVGHINSRWMRLTTLVIATASALYLLALDPRVFGVAKVVLIVMLAIQCIRFVSVTIDWILLRLAAKSGDNSSRESVIAQISGLRWLLLFVAYILIVLLALQNANVDVTSLIAGLGIGGIAIALALQNILGDLFASLTISLDKPFVIGDFIIVGTEMGTVEHIGLKTTRVRSLSGEQLVFGNADLLSSRIRNYKRMSDRRVVLAFGVVYATSPQQLELVNSIVRRAIEQQANVRFDRCHFCKFGSSSLEFEAVYYINSADYNKYMDTQQSVLLSVARTFADDNIEFAFPTQTLYLSRVRDELAVNGPARNPHQS